MSFKIVVDSCCDLIPEYRDDEHFKVVPLTLIVGEEEIVDDETFDQALFLKKVRECSACPKSACPSPQQYMAEYKDADDIYVVTLSEQLSGSYGSAQTGRQMYIEEHGEKNIHVFNSISAACGELLLAKMIFERAGGGMEFEKVVQEVEDFKKSMQTFFVLKSLDSLKKNGRLTGLKSIIATTLNIKPVMYGTRVGTIEKAAQSRGFENALIKMVGLINEQTEGTQESRPVTISHCNNREAAELVKEHLLKKGAYPDVIITDAAGVSSLYANDGGVVVSV